MLAAYAVVALLGTASPSQSAKIDAWAKDLLGTWVVVGLNAEGIVTTGEEESLIGNEVVISADSIVLGNEPACAFDAPYPKASLVRSEDEVPRRSAPDVRAAGLPDAWVVRIDFGCFTAYRTSPEHLVIQALGGWYEVHRLRI